MSSEPMTYAGAGVDVEAGDRAVSLMRAAVTRTHRGALMPPVAGFGGFAGLVDASVLHTYRRPLLATSTDGVGTKVAVAQALDRHDSIGADLVAMVVDDIVVCGARPLFMTDYIACGQVIPEQIATIVAGIAAGCEQAGTALVGGETAEHPGLMAAHEYDLAGAAVGVVEADAVLGPHRVGAGDVVLAMAASGLHANGYSLVRAVLRNAGLAYTDRSDDLSGLVGEALLVPTRIYAADMVELAHGLGTELHALSHITGGGLAANVARVLPSGLLAIIDRSSWQLPTIFSWVAEVGKVPRADAERTLNQGVGMVAVVAADAVPAALSLLAARGLPAWVAGTVTTFAAQPADMAHLDVVQGAKGVDGGGAVLVGEYAA